MLRGRADLTQRQLAAAIGVSERAVQVWEAGLGFPSAASLQRLIALYVQRNAFSSGREVEEAAALWDAALGEAPRLKAAFDTAWFAQLIERMSNGTGAVPVSGASASSLPPGAVQHDWGEAPAVSAFHGRTAEQELLSSWILNEDCRLVGVFGMGGIGKTALAARVADQLAQHFDAVLWRSLRNAPPCADWLGDAILFLSQRRSVPPKDEAGRRQRLLELLRQRRCLLILDNVETVLESGVSPLRYRDGYGGYGVLLEAIGEVAHKSCVLVTSREEPPELGRLERAVGPVRLVRLAGLDDDAGRALLADRALIACTANWSALVRRYSGNALALQVVGELIARVFGGDIAAFLAAGEAVFGDIRRLLQSQVARLSAIERKVLFWLALEREPIDFHTLVADLGAGTPRHEILDALQALDRRSLLELGEGEATFTLQPVVLEHATDEIVSICAAEVSTRRPSFLVSHALIKAQANEHVRRSQKRLVARPVIDRLVASAPRSDVERCLVELLEHWRADPDVEQGFGPANVISLLHVCRGTLRGLNLSHLVIRQADLWGVDAQDANLAESRLEDVNFSQQLGAAISTDVSADGALLAVGTIAGEVRVWRLLDRTPVLLEKHPAAPAWDVALSGDGQLLVSSGNPGGIWLWRTDGSESPRRLAAEVPGLWCVALSQDGRVVVAGAADGTALVWDVPTGEYRATLECHRGGVRGAALSADGRILATGGGDGAFAVWDLISGRQLLNMPRYPGECRAVGLSADGRVGANGDADGLVHVWDIRTGQNQTVLRAHSGAVWSVALTADGGLLATGGADHTVRMWDSHTGQCLRVLHEHSAGVSMISLDADGQLISSVALDGSLRVWETRRGRSVIATRGNVPSVHDVALSTNGQLAMSGGGDGVVRLWDMTTGRCTRRLSGHLGAVWGVAVSADGDVAVSGSLDSTIRVWSVPTGDCLRILTGHTLAVLGVAISPDRRSIASGSFDGMLRLWDTNTGECRMTRECNVSGVRSVRFAANGSLLISGEFDGTVRIWDVASGDCLNCLKAEPGELRALATSADSCVFASAHANGRVRVWETRSGECVRVIQAQAEGVRAVALSANGRRLLSGGVDGTVQVWDVESGQLCFVLRGHSAEVWGVSVHSDDRLVVSGSLDGTLRAWHLERGGVEVDILRPDRPYERMDITGVSGLSDPQRKGLLALGAVAS